MKQKHLSNSNTPRVWQFRLKLIARGSFPNTNAPSYSKPTLGNISYRKEEERIKWWNITILSIQMSVKRDDAVVMIYGWHSGKLNEPNSCNLVWHLAQDEQTYHTRYDITVTEGGGGIESTAPFTTLCKSAYKTSRQALGQQVLMRNYPKQSEATNKLVGTLWIIIHICFCWRTLWIF